jgi:hypothetical protein
MTILPSSPAEYGRARPVLTSGSSGGGGGGATDVTNGINNSASINSLINNTSTIVSTTAVLNNNIELVLQDSYTIPANSSITVNFNIENGNNQPIVVFTNPVSSALVYAEYRENNSDIICPFYSVLDPSIATYTPLAQEQYFLNVPIVDSKTVELIFSNTGIQDTDIIVLNYSNIRKQTPYISLAKNIEFHITTSFTTSSFGQQLPESLRHKKPKLLDIRLTRSGTITNAEILNLEAEILWKNEYALFSTVQRLFLGRLLFSPNQTLNRLIVDGSLFSELTYLYSVACLGRSNAAATMELSTTIIY